MTWFLHKAPVDTCPHCGSTDTERLDIAASSPDYVIWIVECRNCEEWFNKTVEKHPEENKS